MSAYAEDIESIESKRKMNFSEGLVTASRATGRNPFSIALDFNRLRRKRGKLWFYEYIMYELYDRQKWNDEERTRFISAHIHWPLVKKCNNQSWWSVTEDKWLSAAILEHKKVPTPKSLAVFDTTQRIYPNITKLTTVKDCEEFFDSQTKFPIFAKSIDGMWSAGAFRIDACKDGQLKISGRDELVALRDFPDKFLAGKSYIFQECLTPHSFFDGLTDAIATVRCLNLVDENGLTVPHAVLKLPSSGNVADNFWRAGNLICELDPENGRILGVVDRKDGELVRLDALPNSDRKLVGECLPDWDALRKVNEKVALMHSENHFGSTDISLTVDGPVVVEVNNGCAFELIQIATGKGFLTDDILEFFAKNNVKI
ncbi:MAG: sugar-transfer associated ATP-grasp domain-containing protein [Pseudomonadota bacterium]